jgi:hypothetical protein
MAEERPMEGTIFISKDHQVKVVMLPPDGEAAVNRRILTILDLAIAIGRRHGLIRSNIGNDTTNMFEKKQ